MQSTKGPVSKAQQTQTRRSTAKEQKKLDLTMRPSDRDPQLAPTAPGMDSCHHAISDMLSQHQSEEAGPLTGSKSAKGNDKKPKITTAARLSTTTQRKGTASSKGEHSAATASKRRGRNQHAGHADDSPPKIQNQLNPSDNGTKLQRLKLTQPRKEKSRTWQHSSRKKYTFHLTTEVDWNEDLRPTDDEPEPEDLVMNDEGENAGTSVSTPDPELTSDEEHEVKTISGQKRKVSKIQTNSEKRRKVSGATSSSGANNKRQRQLPLAAVSTGHPGASAPTSSKHTPFNLRSNGRIPNGQLASTHTTTTSADPHPGHDPLNSKETAIQQREVIVISSSAEPSVPPIPNTGIDALQSEAYRYRVIGTERIGRGKAVGQKLRDALHGVELHTQLRPAIVTSLQSTQKGLDGIGNEKVASPSSRMHSTTESPNQNSPGHPTLQQDQEVMMAEIQSQSQHHDLLIQDTKTQVETVQRDRPDDREMMTYPSRLREESSSPEGSIHREYSSDETHDEPETNSPNVVNHEAPKVADSSPINFGSLRNSVDHESDTSSRDLSEPEISGFANGYSQNEQIRSNQTPDSQQPLLTQKNPPQHPPGAGGPARKALRMRRMSIVDANGSPRPFEDACLVADRTGSPLKELQIPQSPSPRSSSSVYSDERSPHSSGHDLKRSNYQRGMFSEYGFDLESMRKRPRSALPRDSARDEGSGITTGPRMPRQPDQWLSSSPALAASIATGPDAGGAGSGQNSAKVTNSDLRDKDHPSLHAGRHGEVPLSTQVQLSGIRRSSQSNETNPPDWISALQNAQKDAHDLLQQTNQVSPADPSPIDYHPQELIFGQCLSSQLAAEQEMIQRVLQIYRDGCNRLLNDLSQAQRVRTNLYQQHMASMREQHHAICQDLIRGFQQLDDRVQEGR